MSCENVETKYDNKDSPQRREEIIDKTEKDFFAVFPDCVGIIFCTLDVTVSLVTDVPQFGQKFPVTSVPQFRQYIAIPRLFPKRQLRKIFYSS